MKNIKSGITCMLMLTLLYSNGWAQLKGNGKVSTQERKVAPFDAISVGSAFNVFITQGSVQSLRIITDENLQERIITKVEKGSLIIKCTQIQNPTKMDVFITLPNLSKLDASGAVTIKGETPFKSENFGLLASGAAKIDLSIETGNFTSDVSGASKNNIILKAKTANTEISGAGKLYLKGSATIHTSEISGAGDLSAFDFTTDNTTVEISGAGNASILARRQLTSEISGAGSITYLDKNNTKKHLTKGTNHLTF